MQQQTIFLHPNNKKVVRIIDQRLLPFKYELIDLETVEDAFHAIKEMAVRGAPLIGVTAAYGFYLALLNYKEEDKLTYFIEETSAYLKSARPTAVNLAFAVDEVVKILDSSKSINDNMEAALLKAEELKQFEIDNCRKIGESGLPLIDAVAQKNGNRTVQILTHCNAGWLACIQWGTATAPIYMAHQKGIPVHVWVDETRPRNQGARLTAYELEQAGIPHTVIADNTGGHLMQHGMVDMVITGSDRTTCTGDVANKIGTYLKALAAYDNQIPFYVALPSSTIDWNLSDGIKEIVIEERSEDEVRFVEGTVDNKPVRCRIIPNIHPVTNYGFDVTPARLVTGLITERGVCKANRQDILRMFPEKNI